MPTAKYSLKAPGARTRFKQALLSLPDTDWTEKPEQYCDYRLDGKAATGWLRAKQFSNGTLYLEASTDGLLAAMADLIGQSPVTAAAPAKEKSSGLLTMQGDYIGTDESGKGDYFGPLVAAGVMVTDRTSAILAELGVADSKKLTEGRIRELQGQIIEVVGPDAIVTVEIGPAKYNELYGRFKAAGRNLNHLLAWAHATAIEKLLERFPECRQAVADQFGSEHYIQSQLKERGKGITLYQTPRAEANVAVAAASIMARYHFTRRLDQLARQFNMTLPLGAGPQVVRQAKAFIAAHGRERLGEVAKLHFKTTSEL